MQWKLWTSWRKKDLTAFWMVWQNPDHVRVKLAQHEGRNLEEADTRCWCLTASKRCFELRSRRCPRSTRGQDKQYHPRIELAARSHSCGSPKVHETETESEQEQDATEESDVPEVEISVAKDDLVENTAQDDSDGGDSAVRGAYYVGWPAKQKTADIRKARGLQETSLTPTTSSGGRGSSRARDDTPRDHRDDPPKTQEPVRCLW